MNTLHKFCRWICFASGMFGCVAVQVEAEELPNLVVLMSDDAGYADFGFQPLVADDYRSLTPRIDSIAKQGCRLSNAYMSGAVCSPSRAGFMTGRYQQRFGHDNNIPPGYMKGGLPLTETFMAKRLGDLGYKTGLIGKWHLGYPEDYQPNQRGFDYFYGCLQGSRKYFPIENVSPHRVFLENTTPTEEAGYITDRIGDGACRFIEANKSNPFFLFVSFTATHGPLDVKEEHLKKLANMKPNKRKKNAGLMVSLDENVGKILDQLDVLGLTEKTLVVFTNDNGGQTQSGANNHPLRGRKGQLWEGGVRVPMAIRWPGHIPAGSVFEEPVISLDLFPTFLAAAGKAPDAAWNLDGINLLDCLCGKAEALPERDLYWRRQGSAGSIAIRHGDWKMIHQRKLAGAQPELYHLQNDPSEAVDLAAENPEIVAQLSEKVTAWEAELSEPIWGPLKRRK
ncbi:MAG: sulfatase-like hydrolase/transferase [Pirellulaceae bacterium]|nr:sulfatase-like hydrolase/transferase [Planctomycetaceae bacterium]MDG1807008.1 sulfatase-like hydrolase/transferase [Pirellulaceae bacterium]MDG2102253.1 sulfatase-like hydrolase/transferase [Pirellulaceae bacterium]